MKEFELEGEDSSAELLETTGANEMTETEQCNSGINSFAVVDPRLQGLHCFSFLLALCGRAIWRQSWRDVSSSCSTVSSKVQPWGKHTAWHEIIVSAGLQIPALERGLGLPWHGGLAIDDGSPLHIFHRDSSLIPAGLQAIFDPTEETGGICMGCARRGKSSLKLLCSFHAAWRGRHPVRGDYFVCLVFLTLGKLSPVPGEQDDQCRLPY